MVKSDFGFAPNPYAGYLTLATCKPDIRNAARVGDMLIGTGSPRNVGNGRLIYAGRVSEIVPTDVYGRDPRFEAKRPVVGRQRDGVRGDNIYYVENGAWRQRDNRFHDATNVREDLRGLNVLLCQEFWYFGTAAPFIADDFADVIKKGPNCKYTLDPRRIAAFESWLSHFPRGIHGRPSGGPGPRLTADG